MSEFNFRYKICLLKNFGFKSKIILILFLTFSLKKFKMTTFEDLGLDVGLLELLKKNNISVPTKIQEKTLPLILKGKDVIAGSATGSGKTLAFGLGMIQNLIPGQGVQALILVPTRELAEQVYTVLKEYSRSRKLRTTAVYGGVSLNPQTNSLRSADIVVGTPGRILDHLSRGSIDLSFTKFVVLDEADRMLDMGFLDDVKKIMSQCSNERQSLLFSATLPQEVVRLAKNFMNDPVRVNAVVFVDPKKLKQCYYDINGPLKFSLLAHLLKEDREGSVMIFCNSRSFTSSVSRNLNKIGIDAMAIHGGLSQAERKKVLSRFQNKQGFILVCTDVAARGLDIPGVSHVINYDIPDDSKQYIHRAGRTARAGENGLVINLISHRDYDNFSKVLRDYDLNIQKMERPFIKKIDLPESRSSRGPRRDGQHSGSRNRNYSGSNRRSSGDKYSDSPRSSPRPRRNQSNGSPRGRFGSSRSSSHSSSRRHESVTSRDY